MTTCTLTHCGNQGLGVKLFGGSLDLHYHLLTHPRDLECSICLQASINELEVIVDESNVQISSLKEQLTDAQQQLSAAEAASISLQGTEASLKQQIKDLQVCVHAV